jgi:hypothetical protein
MRTLKLLKNTLKTLQAIYDTKELNAFAQELVGIEISQVNAEIVLLELEKEVQHG